MSRWSGRKSSQHALELIEQIVRESSCPWSRCFPRGSVFIREAAKGGVFAYVVDTAPEELQSAIDITLRRFAEYHDLQDAFKRRAMIEQAKGISWRATRSTPSRRLRCCASTPSAAATRSPRCGRDRAQSLAAALRRRASIEHHPQVMSTGVPSAMSRHRR